MREALRIGPTMGYLHSVETGAAVDGPGMRFVYFMSGCPFRCVYCHNPDTWRFVSGRPVTIAEAVQEIRPYASFLRRAGGVTISGGDPLTQHAFVGELLAVLKNELGLHTALDTQGFLGHKVKDEWFDPVDLVLLDIKHADEKAHKAITGRALKPTLDFAQRMLHLRRTMWLRYVLVPGLTDAQADIERMADLLASLAEVVERVEVLPYHSMGEHKWNELGKNYPLHGTPGPSPESLRAANDAFRARGLPVV